MYPAVSLFDILIKDAGRFVVDLSEGMVRLGRASCNLATKSDRYRCWDLLLFWITVRKQQRYLRVLSAHISDENDMQATASARVQAIWNTFLAYRLISPN